MLKNKSLLGIISIFFAWRLILFVILFCSLIFLPLASRNFLGGGLENYQNSPYIFAWANFDGEHYLSIAKNGYGQYEHSFFPFYPLFIKIISLNSNFDKVLVITGLLISHIFFIAALFLLFKLIKIDYDKKIANWAVLALIFFPTSFYFVSLYTEGLFLFLSIGSFYFFKKQKWLLGGILGGLASVTRVTGFLILPALLIEWKIGKYKKFPWELLIIPFGFLLYLFFLWQTTGNPLAFYSELSGYGVQRQGNFILLPQVFYRYFNMLISVNINEPIYWTVLIELVTAILAISLLIWGYFKKMKLSYLFYAGSSFILPTLTGSFSSLPRYFLTIFPLFILIGILISNLSKPIKFSIISFLIFLLIVETALFLRGYWVA